MIYYLTVDKLGIPTTVAETDDIDEMDRWIEIYKKGEPGCDCWMTSSPLGERRWRKYIPTRRMGPHCFHLTKDGLQNWNEDVT